MLPALSAQFWLLRHGETAFNRAHRLQGQLDLPLNSTGREQARAAGRWLASQVQADHFICSNLARACETAALALPTQEWTIDPAWRERHWAACRGSPRPKQLRNFLMMKSAAARTNTLASPVAENQDWRCGSVSPQQSISYLLGPPSSRRMAVLFKPYCVGCLPSRRCIHWRWPLTMAACTASVAARLAGASLKPAGCHKTRFAGQ